MTSSSEILPRSSSRGFEISSPDPQHHVPSFQSCFHPIHVRQALCKELSKQFLSVFASPRLYHGEAEGNGEDVRFLIVRGGTSAYSSSSSSPLSMPNRSSPSPSPMALSLSGGQASSSIFGKKRGTTPLSAASYLAALSHADNVRRNSAMTSTSSTTTADDSSVSSLSLHSRGSTTNTTASVSSGAATPYDASCDELDEPDVVVDEKLSVPAMPPNSTQVFSTRHLEFGHCGDERYRLTSQHTPGTLFESHFDEDPPYYVLLSTYLSYLILIIIGHVRDFFGKRLYPHYYTHLTPHKGYAPLNSDFDSFYTRRLKRRIEDCFSRPVTNVPGRTITLIERASNNYNESFDFTGTKRRALNVSSYNYLGFAQARGGCADAVEESIKRYGVSACGSRLEGGTLDLHTQAEALVARFVGQEDAIIMSMGFATNSTAIPALVGKGCLVISDEYNHASIRVGIRLSGAVVRTFRHNDMKDLEKLLRECISQGQPRTHRPWKKILLVVEGLYSMEGSMGNIPAIVELKKRYKFYLYIDEAHSIGAMGPQGRGICNYFHIRPSDADILMGTFTKSFGASGGYIAGKRAFIEQLRMRVHGAAYSEAISPPVLTQIIASVGSIMGVSDDLPSCSSTCTTLVASPSLPGVPTAETPGYEHLAPAPASLLPSWMNLPPELRNGSEGHHRLRRLAFNAKYLSIGLTKLGFMVCGHVDSPIIPLLLFNPAKMPMFSRLMLERETPIAVVVVGYPATTLISGRVRFCLSASHTKADVDELLRACDEIGTVLDLKHGAGEWWSVEEVIERAVELVHAEQ